MKYIIEVEKIAGTNLHRAKGFNTLVFDEIGLSRLTPYVEKVDFEKGDIVKTVNGTLEYRFEGLSDNGKLNCVNLNNNVYTTLSKDKTELVRKYYEDVFEVF